MHEMSIVAGILRIAEDEARAASAQVINVIELEIGELAGIEMDALRFCFKVARRETAAADAELVIHEIDGRGFCAHCDRSVAVADSLAICAQCEGPLLEISQGRELRVKSINVD